MNDIRNIVLLLSYRNKLKISRIEYYETYEVGYSCYIYRKTNNYKHYNYRELQKPIYSAYVLNKKVDRICLLPKNY